jgi:uncharacterized protein YjiS (DUF1127 family)
MRLLPAAPGNYRKRRDRLLRSPAPQSPDNSEPLYARSLVLGLIASLNGLWRSWQQRRRALLEFSELGYRDVKDLGFPVLDAEVLSRATWNRSD